MNNFSPDKKITIGFFGHNSTGKTSLGEAIFYNAGLKNRIGNTTEGNTTLDFTAEEKTKKQSINLAMGYGIFNDILINVLDSPGFLDFLGEIISGIYTCDIAALFVNPGSPIEVGFEKSLELIEEYKKPSFMILNGLDKENSDFKKAFTDIKSYSNLAIVPVTIPVGEKGDFKGVINLLDNKMYTASDGKLNAEEIPAALKDYAETYRESMIEAIAEASDELTDKYLETMELSEEDIVKGLKIGLVNNKFRPLFVTSAIKNIGVDVLTEIVSKYFPKYSDFPEIEGELKGEKVKIKRTKDETLTGIVFKTMSDPHLGDVISIKIISGNIIGGNEFYNITKDSSEKAGQIFQLLGEKKEELSETSAGDIVAFVKLKNTQTKDLIAKKGNLIEVPKIEYPEPIYSIAIIPKSKEDQEKVGTALKKLNHEDPSFKFFMDKEFGDFILSGMGDIHISIILEKLKRKFKVELDTEKPKVPYRETITKSAEARGRYKKQTGGKGQFGDTWIKVEPSDKEFEFIDAIVGGVIPKNFIPSVEKGIRGALSSGILAGYPVVNVKAKLYDGSYHPVDSSDMAFQIAGSLGFKSACGEAGMKLLEPIYEFFITVPDDYLGDIMGDLSGRRGRIVGTDQKKAGKTLVTARVPLAEMFTYINTLKSMTSGRGFYTMKFSNYETIPQNIAQKIIEEKKKRDEQN
ncbi:elongation factor G [bacterium]|nr:elongation factor G [bacterium]